MPLSKDPKKRQAQLSNLRPDAAVKAGAFSESTLTPLREPFLVEFTRQFGHVAGVDELRLAADRRARIEAITEWLDKNGVIADKRSGRPRPIVTELERLQAAHERLIRALRARPGAADIVVRRRPQEVDSLAQDLGDPKVRAAAGAYLRAISAARKRRLAAGTPVRSMREVLRDLSDEALDEVEDMNGEADKLGVDYGDLSQVAGSASNPTPPTPKKRARKADP